MQARYTQHMPPKITRCSEIFNQLSVFNEMAFASHIECDCKAREK